MSDSTVPYLVLTPDVCVRALEARDPRFDGLFFVGITSTRIYCRPICPARVSRPDHRRFFSSAATAERAGFRPCRRCRPDLAPGRALVYAVSRLAQTAARRIASGALNGRSVKELARELHVSERHLRRALERELGVSPVELAQTHRLLLAKQLLTDTDLSVSRVAYASGFQSLRRFNVAFRDRYGMNPTTLRRNSAGSNSRNGPGEPEAGAEMLRITLSYRAPLAWDTLLQCFRRDLMPGVESVQGLRYLRTVQIEECSGFVIAENRPRATRRDRSARQWCLTVSVSPSLVPVLMPLMARLRQLFDLDAEPAIVDDCLDRSGLRELVRRRPGLRIPGAVDGFEIGLGMLIRDRTTASATTEGLLNRVVDYLGEPIDTGIPTLNRLSPRLDRVADAEPRQLSSLGVPTPRARSVVALARAVADGSVTLEPGSDAVETHRALQDIPGICEHLAAVIVMRTLGWPDAFAAAAPELVRAADAATAQDLQERAERWRPWRAYAFLHLTLRASDA